MNAPHRTPLRLVEPVSAEVRVITKRYGGILGPVFTVAVGDRYFTVGEMALAQLKRGLTPDDLGLFEIDPDDEPEDY